MRRIIPSIMVIALGVAVAFALRQRFQADPARPSPVPEGDYEIAWIHPSTSPQTWERMVAAFSQVQVAQYGVYVDDRLAFPDQTATVPEIVVTTAGRRDRLRLRWYKLSGEVDHDDWVDALAKRDPPPIAFMGGASSDRAIELAQALNRRTEWKGARPLLFITTATANQVVDPDTGQSSKLIDLYPDRTFRGCFTNEAMARAVVDFVWQSEDLKLKPTGEPDARAYVLAWQDDPYSVDLADQFAARFRERKDLGIPLRIVLDQIQYSVGTYNDLNPAERKVLDGAILPDLTAHQQDRSLLVLPAATHPARRLLRTLAADSPLIGQRLVAVTGDGVSFNTMYRDADVAWPIRELSIPLVFFAHQNPVAWGTAGQPPNATDDLLLFADIIRVIAQGIFHGEQVSNADELAAKLRAGEPPYYTAEGERRPGEGEYVVVVRPQFGEGGRVARDAELKVFTRRAGKWVLVQRLDKPSGSGVR
jgi:hypothetical protein